MSFEEAATAIKQCQNLTNEQKLQIYALYKQSTAGDNNNPQPSAFSPMKRYKHDAWLKLKNLPTTEAQKQYIHLVAELAPGFTPVTTTMDLPIDAELNRTTSISNSNDITPNITPIPTPQSSPQRRTFDPTLGPDTPTSARRRRRDEEGRLTPTFVRSVDIDDHKAYEIEVLYRRSFEEEENDNDNDNDNEQEHQQQEQQERQGRQQQQQSSVEVDGSADGARARRRRGRIRRGWCPWRRSRRLRLAAVDGGVALSFRNGTQPWAVRWITRHPRTQPGVALSSKHKRAVGFGSQQALLASHRTRDEPNPADSTLPESTRNTL